MKVTGYVIVFTTSDVFKCEKLFKKANIESKLVPTPREFSSDCGLSIQFKCDHLDEIHKTLDTFLEYKIEGIKHYE